MVFTYDFFHLEMFAKHKGGAFGDRFYLLGGGHLAIVKKETLKSRRGLYANFARSQNEHLKTRPTFHSLIFFILKIDHFDIRTLHSKKYFSPGPKTCKRISRVHLFEGVIHIFMCYLYKERLKKH